MLIGIIDQLLDEVHDLNPSIVEHSLTVALEEFLAG